MESPDGGCVSLPAADGVQSNDSFAAGASSSQFDDTGTTCRNACTEYSPSEWIWSFGEILACTSVDFDHEPFIVFNFRLCFNEYEYSIIIVQLNHHPTELIQFWGYWSLNDAETEKFILFRWAVDATYGDWRWRGSGKHVRGQPGGYPLSPAREESVRDSEYYQ